MLDTESHRASNDRSKVAWISERAKRYCSFIGRKEKVYIIYYIQSAKKVKIFYNYYDALRRFFGRNFFKCTIRNGNKTRIFISVITKSILYLTYQGIPLAFRDEYMSYRQTALCRFKAKLFALGYKASFVFSSLFIGKRSDPFNERVLSARYYLAINVHFQPFKKYLKIPDHLNGNPGIFIKAQPLPFRKPLRKLPYQKLLSQKASCG